MRVSELVDLVGLFGFSRNPSTLKERANYQRFLNLANLELWQTLINSDIFLEQIDVFLDDQGIGEIPDSYYVKAVFTNQELVPRCYTLNRLLTKASGYYNLLGNKLRVSQSGLQVKTDPSDNTAKKYVTLLVVPNCKTLVETVTDDASEIDVPACAEPHHLTLVHGALYYLFVSGDGFIDKAKYQREKWIEAKANFKTFYDK